MRHLVMILMAVLFLGAPARADETAIRSVISSQIEAFQADDFTTAFTYASPTIRQIFKTPENFGTMVRQGYPMVWRPAETNFLSVEVIDGLLWQNVMIRDQAGGLHILEYQMIELGGVWKINAVRLRKAPDGTA
ncbi:MULTISPECIES: DUF4864 domain-containing protein [unclassified Roseovarius]|uniref:DUF4864 domain-containing protein n=1 Tax=unclassified Roseovarius TaxID=2614913 RepID=UPI00273FDF36|nr:MULTISPECIES: DUF4864 domain-containing protein [unclassified Roseovarius]